ncbi:beta-phosphoglucomutase [Thermotalea metallivorans]|uniref:Beta-phosphoglucomutase n=1 Tax=Thermotalea metallivorans TaxID=520762 RepID=A0A140L2W7_9FIRM|nr:beta-phosphoglucomutase [Thermotalea metallivorans]KXG74892.1 Beta-phosphoglucomutase [Thermotalea metallivorans]
MKEIKGFIFDLDGVITDTAEYHFQAWKALGEGLGIPFDREFNEKLKGIDRMESLEKILEYGNQQNNFSKEEKIALAEKKNAYYQELIKSIRPRDVLPGIEELLNTLRKHHIKIGLASASKNAPAIIDALGVRDYIDYLVDPASVKRGKPAPDIFLEAARGLGVDPETCVGIEDAEAGVEAIKAAGMFAVGVGRKESMKKADFIVENTGELTFENIKKAFCTWKSMHQHKKEKIGVD